MQPDSLHIESLVQHFCAGWLAGDGKRFADSFSPHSRFVAFDGTILNVPAEIAAFHQRAFESHLQGTRLERVARLRPRWHQKNRWIGARPYR